MKFLSHFICSFWRLIVEISLVSLSRLYFVLLFYVNETCDYTIASGTGHTQLSVAVAILHIQVWMQSRSRFRSFHLAWLELLLQQSRELCQWPPDMLWFQQLFCAFWPQNGYLISSTKLSITMTMTMLAFEYLKWCMSLYNTLVNTTTYEIFRHGFSDCCCYIFIVFYHLLIK